jgi:VWFA-related protein
VGIFVRAVGVALAALAIQSPEPARQRPRFTSSIDVVQVDVSAIDSSGRPIRDLTAADFELTVDGRPRPIASAQFVSVPSAADAPATAPPAPAHYSSNEDAAGGRLIMIVVDRQSIATGRGKAAIEAASRFVTSLNRADRVALATIPQGPQVTFTADHALVQRLLQKVDGTAVASLGTRNIGITDALAFERKDQFGMDAAVERECGAATGGRGAGGSDMLLCKNEVRGEAGLVAADARTRARTSVEGLRALIEGLPASETPKLVVFISEGLVIEREAAQLSWLEARAAAAHVTVYTLHLESAEFDAAQRRPQARSSADRAVQEQGLAMVAQSTRGDMFRVVSNSDFAFQRLSNELSGYYLLGFEADSRDRNGRPHAINVAVRRPGVAVRSRRQFTSGTAPARTAEGEIIATLRDPLPATEIPIKVTTYSFRDPHQNKVRLFIAAEIDRSINPGGEMSVGYVVVDFNGRLVASNLNATLTRGTRQAERSDRFFSTVLVDPGKFSLKLAVVDDARRHGSVERVAQAGLNAAGPMRATDLLIADGAGRAADLPLAPAVSGDITGDTLHGYLELFGDKSGMLEQASVTLEIAASESGPALERIPVQLSTPKDDTLCRVAAARVNLGGLPPGRYVARAVIAVGLTSVGQVTRGFQILEAPQNKRQPLVD